jgi:hypothetical protein
MAIGNSRSASAHVFLDLQRTFGNRAVTSLIAGARDAHPLGHVQRAPNDAAAPATSPGAESSGETALRQRVDVWRRAAGEGVRLFVTSELEGKSESSSLDWVSFGIGLAGALITGMTVFIPGPTALVGVVLTQARAGFIGQAAVAISTAIGQASASTAGGESGPGPIAGTERAMYQVLDGMTATFYDSIPGWIAQVGSVDAVLRAMFQPEALRGSGLGRTEVNETSVREEYAAMSSSFFRRFKSQVQPIGREAWGHKKHVVLIIRGGSYDGRHVLAKRELVDRGSYDFEFVRFIDPDMVPAALSRSDAIEEIPMAVEPDRIEDLPRPVPNVQPLPRGRLPERF